MTSADERIETILQEGRGLLAAGRAHDAALSFERLLLLDPAHAEARAALLQARAALAEERRALDAQLAEAGRLLSDGERPQARRLLEDVVARGGDRDSARALLERLDKSASAPAAAPDAQAAPDEARPAARRRRPRARSRRWLTAGWAALLLAGLVGVSARWGDLVARLTARPAPHARKAPPTTAYPAPSPGERAVAEARTLLERGNAEAALAALAGVPPEDPAFPFAAQLRMQAGRARAQEGPAR